MEIESAVSFCVPRQKFVPQINLNCKVLFGCWLKSCRETNAETGMVEVSFY